MSKQQIVSELEGVFAYFRPPYPHMPPYEQHGWLFTSRTLMVKLTAKLCSSHTPSLQGPFTSKPAAVLNTLHTHTQMLAEVQAYTLQGHHAQHYTTCRLCILGVRALTTACSRQ